MVAHLDAVTSLAVDPNGLYLMSGSKSSLLKHAPSAQPQVERLTLSPPQVTTAPSVSGTWRVKPASRSSRLTGRSLRSPSTTWRSTPLKATSPAPGQTLSLRCSYDAELRVLPQPCPLTRTPIIRDQQRHGRGRAFGQGSSPASHSPQLDLQTT